MVTDRTHALEQDERRHFFRRLQWYRRRIESLEAQASLDDLTGLRNQRALWEELSRRAATGGSPFALVMLDFDMFKDVNERYGRTVGDRVLRRVASILRGAGVSARLAFRYGGEEFALVVPGDAEDGRRTAEEVRSQVARLNGALPAVTVSCGVAEIDTPTEPWLALDRADAALRAAKRAGRNRVVVDGADDDAGSAYLVEELEQETARRAALALAAATLEVRDPGTASHSDDVVALCESIGRQLGLTGAALERLTAGAQLHDVGKVAVPREILNKPAPLDEAEWAVIREHTVIGERILRSVPEMAEVATIVRHSHEHWNGTGYPDGLAGDQIPLASRIILCADAFHAIRSDRPYRPGRPATDAITELRTCAGTQLDPTVVAALAQVAADVRAGVEAAPVHPRRRRLIALLLTLAIGSGSAMAAIPDLRDAVGSLFGFGKSDSESAPYLPGTGFDFGPLGDVLSIEAVASRSGSGLVPRSVAVRPARRRAADAALGERKAGARRPSRAAPGPREPKVAHGEQRIPHVVPDRTPGQVPAQAPAGTAPATTAPVAAGDDGSGSGGKSRGRALGKTLPTPRNPAQPPGHGAPGGGRRADPGRTDPPAIGRETGPPVSVPHAGGGNPKGAPKAR